MRAPIRLLNIEDSEDDSALMLVLLRQAGFELYCERVDTARDLAAALDKKWDIVISDHTMPNFSGNDALKMVRALNPELPFIFVSGTIGEDVAAEAMRSGAQDYVMKTSLQRLAPAVERELCEAEGRRERKHLDRRVSQLQKFEAVGRLVGGIAHDFNNMIGAILGWAEMGRDDSPADSKTHERFQKICQQSLRAGKLTGQLLAYASGQAPQTQKLNLNVLVQEEIALLSRIIGDDIKIRIHTDPNLRVTAADPTQIEQVLMNLCLNARDAMPGGGDLVVETRNVELDAKFCRDRGFDQPGSYVLLSVTDTGSGIDSTNLERIFEPFFTTKSANKDTGLGLGLATVYNIVKHHGGFVFASSNRGAGTCFRVYLPAKFGEQELREAPRVNEPPRGTETILLLESHDGLRATAQEMLEKLGYQVMAAGDGRQGVELFKKNYEHIDLVMMDVVLPSLNGPAAYSEMSALRPEMRVILTSGYAPQAKELAGAMEKGACVLRKPYSLISLSQMIRSALEQNVQVTAR
ncbi:MAG TPA: response regulator [Candidatus Acidoferrum sp.]|jgi:signal transduction histidine kinase